MRKPHDGQNPDGGSKIKFGADLLIGPFDLAGSSQPRDFRYAAMASSLQLG